MSATYFWDGEQLIIAPDQVWLENCKPYLDMLCVDEYSLNASDRYGKYIEDDYRGLWWKNISLADFPKEFRTQLLLLGVT